MIESTKSPPTTVRALLATPKPLARLHRRPPETVKACVADANAVRLMLDPLVEVCATVGADKSIWVRHAMPVLLMTVAVGVP